MIALREGIGTGAAALVLVEERPEAAPVAESTPRRAID